MRKLVWAVNVSLDGFADHTVGIATDDDSFGFFNDLLDDTGVVVFGRATYQLMEAAWPAAHNDPNATRPVLEFADKLNAIPKVVFSRTLATAEWTNTRFAREDLVDEVIRLKQEPGKNILVDGISVAQELIRLDLIDEYWFVVHPILAGRGRRMIDNLDDSATLRLLETRVFASGAVALHYENRQERS